MEYFGQFGIDRYLHEKFFTNHYNGLAVECGACDGLLESTCLCFERSFNWKVYNIEAAPPLYEMLVKNRPNSINLNYGLSDKDSIATFSHVISPDMGIRFGNGSLTHHPDHIRDLKNQGCKFVNFSVPCKKFSQIYKEEREIDLFVLDIEGHELQALPGIMELKQEYLPRVFCIEHSFVGINNINNILGEKYKLHSVQKQNAIYVKK